MKYLMLVYADESLQVSPEDADVGPWVEEMVGRGVNLMGSRLRPPAASRAVRIRDGELTITDGPYAEAKEQFAGFDIIECADLDEAVEVASRHPVARFGAIELRPFWAFDEE